MNIYVLGSPSIRIERVLEIVKRGDYVVVRAKIGGAVIAADKFISASS